MKEEIKYTIVLPENLNKFSIRDVVINFRQYVDDLSNGSELLIDMTKVEFIDPAGMISLSNIIQWSQKIKEVDLTFIVDINTLNKKNRQALEYLSDCGFLLILVNLLFSNTLNYVQRP